MANKRGRKAGVSHLTQYNRLTPLREGVHVLQKNGVEYIVDTQDLEYAQQFYWSATSQSKRYLGNTKGVYLHRFILAQTSDPQTFPYLTVDHINGNTFDNRRDNLRVVSRGVNVAMARHQRKGTYRNVYLNEQTQTYRAQFEIDNVRYQKVFSDEMEAARWVDAVKRTKHHGPLPPEMFNFPSEVSQ